MAERDHTWNKGITQRDYTYYYDMAWQSAYLILKSEHLSDTIANKVMDELWNRTCAPTNTEIESHIRTLARSRSIDVWRTKRYKIRQMWESLTKRNEEGEEYEAFPEILCCASAEDAFYQEQESERFAQGLAQAMLRLNPLQRVCFALCVMEGMKVAEVAERLGIHATKVSDAIRHAKRRIARLLEKERIQDGGQTTKERRSSQWTDNNLKTGEK